MALTRLSYRPLPQEGLPVIRKIPEWNSPTCRGANDTITGSIRRVTGAGTPQVHDRSITGPRQVHA